MFASRNRRAVALGALLAAVLGGVAMTRFPIAEPAAAAHASAAAPAEVDVAPVIHRTITEAHSFSGRLEAVDKVDIQPQVVGTIIAVFVKDGGLVKKGDPLFTIDPRPYQAEVERAAAQLAAAETRLGYASLEAERAERLLATNAIARRDFDGRQNAHREAGANVKAARAALDAARINLAYTQITAPVAGRVSRAELTVGNVVSAGPNAPVLTTLVSVSPIYASFDMDEQTYLLTLRHDLNGALPVSLGLADEDGYSRQGRVVSVDNHLDTGSGTIRVRARFDNVDGALVPGLYARLKVSGGVSRPAILVDDGAIGTDQAKKYVFAVDPDNRIRYQEVVLGGMHEGLRVIASGLEPGDRIIVNGLQRAQPNLIVSPHLVEMAAAHGATSASN